MNQVAGEWMRIGLGLWWAFDFLLFSVQRHANRFHPSSLYIDRTPRKTSFGAHEPQMRSMMARDESQPPMLVEVGNRARANSTFLFSPMDRSVQEKKMLDSPMPPLVPKSCSRRPGESSCGTEGSVKPAVFRFPSIESVAPQPPPKMMMQSQTVRVKPSFSRPKIAMCPPRRTNSVVDYGTPMKESITSPISLCQSPQVVKKSRFA